MAGDSLPAAAFYLQRRSKKQRRHPLLATLGRRGFWQGFVWSGPGGQHRMLSDLLEGVLYRTGDIQTESRRNARIKCIRDTHVLVEVRPNFRERRLKQPR